MKARGRALDAGLSQQDQKDARDLLKLFDSMATHDEKVILLPQRANGTIRLEYSMSLRRSVVQRLHELMVA